MLIVLIICVIHSLYCFVSDSMNCYVLLKVTIKSFYPNNLNDVGACQFDKLNGN
jgi:hypothetical protein